MDRPLRSTQTFGGKREEALFYCRCHRVHRSHEQSMHQLCGRCGSEDDRSRSQTQVSGCKQGDISRRRPEPNYHFKKFEVIEE